MQVITINQAGIEQIHAFLGAKHKLGADHFTGAMLFAWAAESEASWREGNDAAIEIRPRDSISGRPEVLVIDPAGYDIEDIE